MEKIEWSDDYSVGVELFDEQHRQLLAIVNRLIEIPDLAVESVAVAEISLEMVAYAERHFTEEEGYLVRYGYPDFERHKAEHDEFASKTASLREAARIRVQSVPEAMVIYLRHWFINHILKTDMAYREFFQGKEIPESDE